jgi:hypothetical protein
VIEDEQTRMRLLLVAVLLNSAMVALNLFGVFDDAPLAVWYLFFAIEILVVLPLLILVGIGLVRARKARRTPEL